MKLPGFQTLPIVFYTVLLLLQACSGGSGGGSSDRDPNVAQSAGSGQFAYTGPAPASDEIQSFKISFYDNLVDSGRCGDCHTSGGAGSTPFVDREDVNFAWQQASTLVDLQDPVNSIVVQRVASGHHCWLGADQTASCAATVTAYIERWANGSTQSIAEVQLLPRNAISPSGSKTMPATFTDAQALGVDLTATDELMDLLSQYCSGCHSDIAATAQSPYFASSDTDIAYQGLSGKIDLIDPSNSRLVLRLRNDSHNCWDDCDSNALEMELAISRFSSNIAITDVDSALVISMAQVLENDGIIASIGGRYESDMVAKWEFREGKGSTVADTSGVQPEMPLTLSGEYDWLSSWGVRFINAKAQGGVAASGKLYDLISATGEYTIEAWIAPNNVTQEDAWIAGYAGSASSRNFLLSQTLYNYELYNRSSATEDNGGGNPALSTADDDEQVQATLQHVVVTFDPVQGRRIYVNGIYTGDNDGAGGGLINGWNESFALVLGNTPGYTFPWAGTMRMAAIYNRKLTAEQIQQNFDVGVGQKYFLMFSVSELLDQENVCHIIEADMSRSNYCYVVYEVSQFDDSSYLFDAPFFVNINPVEVNLRFDLQGISLGINGKLVDQGQGFLNINTVVDSEQFVSQGQLLSTMGSIIPLENGSAQDMFFLAFENIDGKVDTTTDSPVNGFDYTLTGVVSADLAIRTFDQINDSFSAVTGVPSTTPAVAATYQLIRRQLPSVTDFQAYMSSHHMAATQLAAVYCDALAKNTSLRSAADMFSDFDFSQAVGAVTDNDWSTKIIFPLIDKAMNTGLQSQPSRPLDGNSSDGLADRGDLQQLLLALINDPGDNKPYVYNSLTGVYDPGPDGTRDGLKYCDPAYPCPGTTDVVKAVCTAVLASGAVHIQ